MTQRQQQILDFIREEQQAYGVTPSTREIQRHFGYSTQTTVMDHLRALEQKGMLLRQPGKARALILKKFVPHAPMIDIPLYGTIPAGMPADQQQESDGCISIDLESIHLPRGARVFALKANGDSMVNAAINNNDTVILECKEPQNWDVVAALIDGESALKRFIVQEGKPFLRAENVKYPDLIPAQELVIQGVMVALFRVVKK